MPNPQPRRLRPAHKASPPAARNAEASREASRCDAHRVLRPAPRQGHHGGVCRHHADRGLTLTTRQTREVVSADPLPRWPRPVARLWTLVPAPPAVEQGPPLAHPPWMALQVPSCRAWCEGVPPAGTLQSASHADRVHLLSPSLQIGPPVSTDHSRHRQRRSGTTGLTTTCYV